jgi:hypothetical protein
MSLIPDARRSGYLYPSIRGKHLPMAQERMRMPERPATRLVVAALTVALLGTSTGCLGVGPGTSATATPTTAATPTTTPTATANTDCPPALTVTEIDADQVDTDSAVAYENLTADQRATFDRARNGTAVEGFDYAWHDIDLVEYEGRYYRAGILVC